MGKEEGEEDLEKGDTSANSVDENGASSPLPPDDTKVHGLEVVNEKIGLPACPPTELDNCGMEQQQQKVVSIKKGPELNVDDEELPGAFEVVGGTEESTKKMGGLELIEDNEVGPPLSYTEFDDSIKKKNSQYATTKKVPELITSEEDLPKPPGAYEEVGAVKFNEKIGGLEQINDDACPPISPSSAFDDSMEKKIRSNENTPLPPPPSQSLPNHGNEHQENISLGEKIRRNVQVINQNRTDDDSVSGYTHAQRQPSDTPLNDVSSEIDDRAEAAHETSCEEEEDEDDQSELGDELKKIPTRRIVIVNCIIMALAITLLLVFGFIQATESPSMIDPTYEGEPIQEDSINWDDLDASIKDLEGRAEASAGGSTVESDAPAEHTSVVSNVAIVLQFDGAYHYQQDLVAISIVTAETITSSLDGQLNAQGVTLDSVIPINAGEMCEMDPCIKVIMKSTSNLPIWLEISGHYTPPPNLDFTSIVQDSIYRDAASIRRSLMEYNLNCGEGCDLRLPDSFETSLNEINVLDLSEVETWPPVPADTPVPSDTPALADASGNLDALVISCIITAAIAVILGLFLCFWRKSFNNYHDTTYYAGTVLFVILLDASILLFISVFLS